MVKKGTILIVDDNKSVLNSLNLFLKHKIDKVITCSNPNQILSILKSEEIDLVLLDMNFSAGVNSGNEGIFWLREIHKVQPQMVVILITAYGDIELAVNAMKEGANDFILKPWDNQKLLATILNGIELSQSRKEVSDLKQKTKQLIEDTNTKYQDFIGKAPAMLEMFKTIEKVARTDANILILGENGTGKEMVARHIHMLSKRSDKIFLGVDLGSLSESLFESELFGYTKGAFTDAKDDRQGRFQTASEGTLFLDEIGNISPTMQSKMLSVIQNKTITPIGSNKATAVDVRLICATNQNLQEMVKQGAFREDLLYRINTIQINIPPLRERGNDIAELANYFLNKYADKYDKPVLSINDRAINKLTDYPWPGNVRELSHCIERAVILSDKDVLTPTELFLNDDLSFNELGNSPMTLDDAEKILIGNSIKRNKGNLSNVARELKIGRQTLYRKMEKYGL
ncbi:MAG TPA: sigma-54-dependent Fis family transcriptional regulator [Bacteroidales bacterium]|nr:sigma-54-dependent Fis family transcriptional regulator [Bacteroidales bacterium]